MKKQDLEAKLATGNFYLYLAPWGTWQLVDRRNNIPCAGRINPKTAERLSGVYAK